MTSESELTSGSEKQKKVEASIVKLMEELDEADEQQVKIDENEEGLEHIVSTLVLCKKRLFFQTALNKFALGWMTEKGKIQTDLNAELHKTDLEFHNHLFELHKTVIRQQQEIDALKNEIEQQSLELQALQRKK